MARFREQMTDYARGETLKRLREAKHLSQERAASQIGVSVKAYREWEKHGGQMRWPNVEAAAKVLGIKDPEELVRREDDATALPAILEPETLAPDLRQLEARLDSLETALLSKLSEVHTDLEEMRRFQERWRRDEGDTGS